ncbi:hypothetical protein M4D76_27625 [Peribacillus frigoritolerans]|uniref:hypothetical protein n=1 Tax=Peribacillus frigoritolerans TaxID=450367 RepID=UPI0021A428C3|nr:hypothetical protein [Peribacillus frigoritolerans]MCT1392018.1 hypothetical protein [Peribacillus frigoritolerans]
MRKLMDNTDYEDCLTIGKLYEVSQDSHGMYSLVDDNGDALQTMLDRFVPDEKSNKYITLHCYTDQLVNNDDGKFDKFGSAWFTVPRNWAEEQAIHQGYDSLETFLKEYTYDETDDWLRQATNEGVLIGTGTGDMREY